jgi:hypothetical protein
MGQKFFEGDFPRLVKALENISKHLDKDENLKNNLISKLKEFSNNEENPIEDTFTDSQLELVGKFLEEILKSE